MPLGSLRASPRILAIPLSATAVAPIRTRVEPFIGGQLVQALSAGAAALFGANLNKAYATGASGRYCKFKVEKANVAGGSGIIAQTAAAREADGDVSGDLTIAFGNADADIILAIPADGAFLAAEVLAMVVLVNGVPLARVVDGADPGVGQWAQVTDNHSIKIGASTGADVLKVGTEIEVFIPEVVGALAKVSPTTGLSAGAALVAGVAEERRIGTIVATIDTMGRAYNALANCDIVAADVAAAALINITK